MKGSLLECNEAQGAQNFKIDREIEIENTEVEGDMVDHNITENEIEKGEYRNEIKDGVKIECPGKHAIVNFCGKLYPGIVKEVSQKYVNIYCMKKIRNAQYTYIWPRPHDKCWCSFEDVVTGIPDPKPLVGSEKNALKLTLLHGRMPKVKIHAMHKLCFMQSICIQNIGMSNISV